MIALAEAGLGNIDVAFEWVNRGIEARDTNMTGMAPAGTTVVPFHAGEPLNWRLAP